jgi:hypothetical protein
MPLDDSKLNKVHRYANGAYRAQCPACAEMGQDRQGHHLYVYPDGRFGCAAQMGDAVHRKRIWQLARGATPERKVKREPAPAPVIDAASIMDRWLLGSSALGGELGVTSASLDALGVRYATEYRAWAFPMFAGSGQMIGIQLRYASGVKRCVTGSHGGLFIPRKNPETMALLPEGASGTAAALDLGFYAIGRFNASAGMEHIKQAVSRLRVRRAVIIADNDENNAGTKGAESIARQLPIPTAILVLPVKDLRDFLNCGGTADLLQSEIDNLVWRTNERNHTELNQPVPFGTSDQKVFRQA